MKKLKITLAVVFGFLAIGLGLFLSLRYFKPKEAGVLIETTPQSLVYINGQFVGKTPHRSTGKRGEAVVRLVPESPGSFLAPFETEVALVPGIQTVIRREFGETEEESGGEIISFEKEGGTTVGVAVVSIPDAAQISIDGTTRGFAPYKNSSLAPGEHHLKVSAPNFLQREFFIQLYPGYKLTAVVKLAQNPAPSPIPTPIPSLPETLVEILPTPTGFLRVRSQPGTVGKEIGQVKPGERFRFLYEDPQTGWFKIVYSPDKKKTEEGWVSNQYSKKIEGVLEDSQTPVQNSIDQGSPDEN